MTKILVYLLLAILMFVTFQWAMLYVQGSDRSYQSLYRSQPVKRVLAPEKPHKSEQRVTLDCVPIQVIVDKASSEASGKPPEQGGLDAKSFQTLAQNPSQGLAGNSPIQTSERHYPYLLNRFHLKAPILDDQSLAVYLQANGSTTLEQTPDPSLFALGRLREIGLWAGIEGSASGSDATSADRQLSYTFDISYQQDLFKVGPAWTRLRAEAGWSQAQGMNGKVQLGVPVLRF